MDERVASTLADITAGKLGPTDLIAVCNSLAGQTDGGAIAALYRTWLDANAASPLAYAVRYNLGVVLSGIGDVEGASTEFAASVQLKPDFYAGYINLGTAYERLGRTGDAITAWLNVVNRLQALGGETVNLKLTALKQIGRVLEPTHLCESGEDALKQAIEIAQPRDAMQHWAAIRQKQCKWPVLTPLEGVTRTAQFQAMSPHCLVFHTDDPLLHLARAHAYYQDKIGRPSLYFQHRHRERLASRPKGRKLRIAYFSSYFLEHAHGYLTAEMYRLHDRDKIEVFVYSCSRRSNDRIQTQIKADVDHWVDILDMTDEQAAQRIFDDEIDVLIDFNGYTGDARTRIVAMRPAPIIVNWLGYPGSMGTPYHHYVIADDFIIPEGAEMYYSEAVLRLPCYQPNDRKRLVANNAWTREAAGLPKDGTVFCAFNGLQKITPQMWMRFMAILAQVPGSVLWLLDGTETTNTRLRAAALQCGIAPERLVFAPKMTNEHHLSRYPLADLFLDTSPCGAHTTASDALWMGVPVLTVAGRGFASRVCGSLVSAAGLPELVCASFDDYLRQAVALGKDRTRIAKLKKKLAKTRDTCDLFDTDKLVRHLDGLLLHAWDRFVADDHPVPDLTNLDCYNQIGTALDQDGVELLTRPDYHDLYLARLREIDVHQPLKPDSRLWR